MCGRMVKQSKLIQQLKNQNIKTHKLCGAFQAATVQHFLPISPNCNQID